jgi:ubiquinone/menaquinone biosynthesis C-methylase UbiE
MTKTLDQISDHLENIRPCKQIVANELKDKEFKNVLEVGCQWGESLKAINDIFPDKELTGLDADYLEIERAISLLPNIKFMVGNANSLPFEKESFDVVFTNALFCMVRQSDVENIINEIIRVAKRYIYLVELDSPLMIDSVDRDRVSANWVSLFKARGYKAEKRK